MTFKVIWNGLAIAHYVGGVLFLVVCPNMGTSTLTQHNGKFDEDALLQNVGAIH
jgi:hypothetical protein